MYEQLDAAGLDGTVVHRETLPAAPARFAPWPQWVSTPLRDALAARSIPALWAHQGEVAQAAHDGRHTVLATGTASGKSLAYQLPIVAALATEPKATALYLAPTKALGAGQVQAATALLDALAPAEPAARTINPVGYDGDTDTEIRRWARSNSRWLFTNPDMLHLGILPNHPRWAHFFRNLRYVVIDEAHHYRGIFGSHVALVIRRLRRVARFYGAEPVFILASATSADPATMASALVGSPVEAVTESGAPVGARTIAFWQPPALPLAKPGGTPLRRPAAAEAADLLATLVRARLRTLAFVGGRHSAELTAGRARDALRQSAPALVERIGAYRAGYLPDDRRRLEAALLDGRLLGAATTNALELGVDIAGLDAVVIAGYPGSVASFWQQGGRCGRAGSEGLVVYIGRDDPLDQYVLSHPETLLHKPFEITALDPDNPYVAADHLACMIAELPLSPAEATEVDPALLARLETEGTVRRRVGGWYPAPGVHPHAGVSLRGNGALVLIVDATSGEVLGTADAGAAPAGIHPGAIHLHQGRTYLVDALSLDDGVALVHEEDPGWSTSARSRTDIAMRARRAHTRHGSVEIGLADVQVTRQVIGYLRRLPTGEVVDQLPLDMPEHVLDTRAVYYAIDPEALTSAGIEPERVPGALHAAEHAAIGLLPLFAGCDRADIGGLSIAVHPDTGVPTVFVYDGFPGGAGFAEAGYGALARWLRSTRDAVATCGCESGCPSCVQSPKCGNGNEPLDKAGAVAVLDVVLAALTDRAPVPSAH